MYGVVALSSLLGMASIFLPRFDAWAHLGGFLSGETWRFALTPICVAQPTRPPSLTLKGLMVTSST